MSSNFTFFTDFLGEISTLVTNYVNTTAGNVIGNLAEPASLMGTIAIALLGWAMLQGLVQEPLMRIIRLLLKIGIVSGLALSLGTYNQWVANFVLSFPSQLAASLTSGASSSTSGLDTLLDQGFDIGTAYWNQGSALSLSFGPYLEAFLIWIVTFVATGYGAFLFALSTMALGVLLAVGPVFILLSMFDVTKNFLSQWIAQVATYMLVQILTVAVVGLIVTAATTFTSAIDTTGSTSLALQQAVPAILAMVIGFLLLCQVQSIASGLGAGVQLATGDLLPRIGRDMQRRAGGAFANFASSRGREIAATTSDVGGSLYNQANRRLQSGARSAGYATGYVGARTSEAAGIVAAESMRASIAAGRWVRNRFNWKRSQST